MKNPFGIQTRTYNKKDYNFVYINRKKTLLPYIKEYEPINKKDFDKDFTKRYKEIIILMKGKRRIGFYHIVPDTFVKNALYLVMIFVAPAYQKKKIGYFLMKYFETLGYKKIRLRVWDNNPAIKFYTKLGYKVISKKNHRILIQKNFKTTKFHS